MISLKIFFNKRVYFSSAFFYSCLSLLFSTWVTYIPYIAEKIGISEGKIGGSLFFASLGSFIMIPICKRLIERFGVGRMALFSLILYSVTVFGPFISYNYATLCASLFLFGMAGSSFVITINSLTATIEKTENVYIMSGSHGFYSAGGMIGAGIGSFIAALLHNPFLHVFIVVALVLGVQLYFRKDYYHIKNIKVAKTKSNYRSYRPLILIALVGIVFMVSEGAISDWSALYLKKVAKTNLAHIGLGYAGFSMAMTIGRFLGDWISKKFGSWQLIMGGAFISLLGFATLLTFSGFTSILGFTIVGLGFSVIVPEVYRIASHTHNVDTAAGVSFIAGSANVGFLIGPVLLGLLAELRTLHFSFLMLSGVVFMTFLFAIYQSVRIKNRR